MPVFIPVLMAIAVALGGAAVAQDSGPAPAQPKMDRGHSQGLPDRDAGPRRERIEEQAKATTQAWVERVSRFAEDPRGTTEVDRRNAAQQLKKAADALLQDVKRLSQVQDDHFNKVYAEFVQHEEEIQRVWNNVHETGKVGPKAKN